MHDLEAASSELGDSAAALEAAYAVAEDGSGERESAAATWLLLSRYRRDPERAARDAVRLRRSCRR